ncbi:MAG: LysM peptidoglycan-binding domain-containing protein [Anaerolineaceae bacterium]
MNDSLCPYLGRADDRETAYAFSSPGHRCFRLEKPSPITLTHQTTYCISENFHQCPVFQLASSLELYPGETVEKQAPEPEAVQPPGSEPVSASPSTSSRIVSWVDRTSKPLLTLAGRILKINPDQSPAIPIIFITALAILIISVVLFLVVAISYFSSPHMDEIPEVQIITQAAEMQPDIFLITLTPTMRSAFVQKLGFAGISQGYLLVPLDTPSPEPSPITIVVTPTDPPSETSGYHACGAPSNWVPYIVQTGDSLSALSVEYNVPLFELASNNCHGVTDNLYTGAEIFVPSK